MNSVTYREQLPTNSFRKLNKVDKFQEELDILESKGIYFIKHTPFHIKVEDLNYYSSGVVNFDGSPKLGGKGLAFFLRVLASEGFVKEVTPKEEDHVPKEKPKNKGIYLSELPQFEKEDVPF